MSHRVSGTVRRLVLWTAFAVGLAASIVVGTVIGSGIFLVPRAMIQRVGTPEMVFFVWVFGGLLSLELLSALPRSI